MYLPGKPIRATERQALAWCAACHEFRRYTAVAFVTDWQTVPVDLCHSCGEIVFPVAPQAGRRRGPADHPPVRT